MKKCPRGLVPVCQPIIDDPEELRDLAQEMNASTTIGPWEKLEPVAGYEVEGMMMDEDRNPERASHNDEKPTFWAVYSRNLSDGHASWIADFNAKKDAEKFKKALDKRLKKLK